MFPQFSFSGQMYIISQIKKGVVPDIVEYYFLINSPVIFGGRTASRGEFPHMVRLGTIFLSQAFLNSER